MKTHRFNALVFAVFAALFFAGCQSFTVEKGGPWDGDELVAKTTLAIKSAHVAIDGFLLYEATHRSALGSDVRSLANNLRDEAPRAEQSVLAARDLYMRAKSPASADRLTEALNELERLMELVKPYVISSEKK